MVEQYVVISWVYSSTVTANLSVLHLLTPTPCSVLSLVHLHLWPSLLPYLVCLLRGHLCRHQLSQGCLPSPRANLALLLWRLLPHQRHQLRPLRCLLACNNLGAITLQHILQPQPLRHLQCQA